MTGRSCGKSAVAAPTAASAAQSVYGSAAGGRRGGCLRRSRARHAGLQQLLRCQYLYFCTSKARKLSTCGDEAEHAAAKRLVHFELQLLVRRLYFRHCRHRRGLARFEGELLLLAAAAAGAAAAAHTLRLARSRFPVCGGAGVGVVVWVWKIGGSQREAPVSAYVKRLFF